MTTPHRIITQGHRGARGVLPENTLAGIAHALDAGIDRIEIDVNLSKDDRLLVVHDETTHPDLVRDRHGCWLQARTPWRDLEYDAIARFDVGRIRPDSPYAARFPHQRPVDGSRIPLLEEVGELIRERGHGELNIEIKCDPGAPEPRPDTAHFAECVVSAISRLDLGHLVTVQSFNWGVVEAVRRLDGDLVTGCLSSEWPPFDTIERDLGAPSAWTNGLYIGDFDGSLPAMVKAMGVNYWASEFRDLNADVVRTAHELGLAVHAWTVNEEAIMKNLIMWETDSIISDYPQTLLAVVSGGN